MQLIHYSLVLLLQLDDEPGRALPSSIFIREDECLQWDGSRCIHICDYLLPLLSLGCVLFRDVIYMRLLDMHVSKHC